MSSYHHSKSALFLMELLFNLLLFSILCACGLLFFVKSSSLTKSTNSLHRAVSITSSVAALYQSGDGSFTSISKELSHSVTKDDSLYIYYDKEFNCCEKADCNYYVVVKHIDNSETDSYIDNGVKKISIKFFNNNSTEVYSITACHYAPKALENVKEVTVP